MWGWGWRPYVPVAQRRANAAKQTAKLLKKGVAVEPVTLDGRRIARTFWGEAWCSHLESFSDFANRLPRGRTYVRNGSVCHLAILKGKIEALVSGSELYTVSIRIGTLPSKGWADIKRRCVGQIASLLDLLKGRLSDGVMSVVTDRQRGLFPQPGEIDLKCSCPDWAVMCKHVAAVLYGVGARLDHAPELLFTLRGVDHAELVQVETAGLTAGKGKGRRLRAENLEEIFGIDLAPAVKTPASPDAASAPGGRRSRRRAAAPAAPPERPRAARRAAKPVARPVVPARTPTRKGRASAPRKPRGAGPAGK
ncbi:MAG: SWIM zinc finger family protein [candidate division NC10 bacterium]